MVRGRLPRQWWRVEDEPRSSRVGRVLDLTVPVPLAFAALGVFGLGCYVVGRTEDSKSRKRAIDAAVEAEREKYLSRHEAAPPPPPPPPPNRRWDWPPGSTNRSVRVPYTLELRPDETVLTEGNRRRLVEEMSAVVSASLPPILKMYAEQTHVETEIAGDPSVWHPSRSIIDPQ